MRVQAEAGGAPDQVNYRHGDDTQPLSPNHFLLWLLGSFCAFHKIPFAPELIAKQFPPPYVDGKAETALIQSASALGFKIKARQFKVQQLAKQALPCIVQLNPVLPEPDRATSPLRSLAEHATAQLTSASASPPPSSPAPSQSDLPFANTAIVLQADEAKVLLFYAGNNTPTILPVADFAARFTGHAYLLAPAVKPLADPDALSGQTVGQTAGQPFGFAWFVPALLKHRSVWRDVLLASLVLQLIALATPLFTQTIIDKVVVHRTESTLIVIGVALAVFTVFGSLLTWVRQYLILHTGNRVDAVLGAAVFEHLFKLPPRYFQHRPTGVVAARLHGVETIREFIASAAVTLVLDCPFLLICLAIMFYYHVGLSCLVLGILAVIVLLSVLVAPVFQQRLNQQFLLGARNQAFVTEYIAGFETVKSLQMEPQLNQRYGDYLSTYLQAGFQTKQIGNTYNVIANTLEQSMSLLILIVGAYTVMTTPEFTIGMLVAFQMFAGKLSQPLLRMVGLWQQFQQSALAVQRLGDVMNMPPEPYSVLPQRPAQPQQAASTLISISNLAFRYADDLPFLYQHLNITIRAGSTTAIMGPSGSGKSTLTKLLQGFYLPTEGQIKVDDIDIRHLSANELRHYFGVVPQETVLFSGTIYDNLQMANPHASFEQIVTACRMAEIHAAIAALPKGYQTEIGERGAGLSGGQKQRIAIARALLKQPRILIFDEATSNLDSETAEQFAQTINQLKGKVTMLFITHALPRGLGVDEVLNIHSTKSNQQ